MIYIIIWLLIGITWALFLDWGRRKDSDFERFPIHREALFQLGTVLLWPLAMTVWIAAHVKDRG